MGGEDELHLRQGLGHRPDDLHLPLRVQVQIDLVHQDDATVFDQLLARKGNRSTLVQQVGNPADERPISVRQRLEGNRQLTTIEQVVPTIVLFAAEAVFTRLQ